MSMPIFSSKCTFSNTSCYVEKLNTVEVFQKTLKALGTNYLKGKVVVVCNHFYIVGLHLAHGLRSCRYWNKTLSKSMPGPHQVHLFNGNALGLRNKPIR